jgi:hypothetical protein
MSPGNRRKRRAARPAAGRSRPPAPREQLQLKAGFKKSLSISGEGGSLAGDRVVSRERSRPADLPRRQDLQSRRAGSYPSHCCGCVSWRAFLAGDLRCRKAVTARDVNSIAASECGQSIALTLSEEPCGRSGFRKRARPCRSPDRSQGRGLEAPARQITGGLVVRLILDAIGRDSLKKGHRLLAPTRRCLAFRRPCPRARTGFS